MKSPLGVFARIKPCKRFFFITFGCLFNFLLFFQSKVGPFGYKIDEKNNSFQINISKNSRYGQHVNNMKVIMSFFLLFE